MIEGKQEGKKCAYDCRDQGFDCDWHCDADNDDQLREIVQAHTYEYHSIWSHNKEGVSEYAQKTIKKTRE